MMEGSFYEQIWGLDFQLHEEEKEEDEYLCSQDPAQS